MTSLIAPVCVCALVSIVSWLCAKDYYYSKNRLRISNYQRRVDMLRDSLRRESEIYAELTQRGFKQFTAVTLADHSAKVYGDAVSGRVVLIKEFPADPEYPEYPTNEARELADKLNETL